MTEPHRHEWTRAEEHAVYTCTQCAETSPPCCDCDQPTGTALEICQRCIDHTARTLRDIETAVSWFRWAPPSTIQATRYDRVRVNGTSGENTPTDWTIRDLPEILEGWAAMWGEASGDTRASGNLKTVDYLAGHLIYAAHHRDECAWDDFKTEARRALYVAKRDAGLLPKRAPAPCVYCGGVAVQAWAGRDLTPNAHGLDDEVVCLGCGKRWPNLATYTARSRYHLRTIPEVMPGLHVTATEAMTIWPEIPAGTWRTWAGRDQMPEPVGWDERGAPMYEVRALAELINRRADTQRRGRKPANQDAIVRN